MAIRFAALAPLGRSSRGAGAVQLGLSALGELDKVQRMLMRDAQFGQLLGGVRTHRLEQVV
jgi:hypothetical protein